MTALAFVFSLAEPRLSVLVTAVVDTRYMTGHPVFSSFDTASPGLCLVFSRLDNASTGRYTQYLSRFDIAITEVS